MSDGRYDHLSHEELYKQLKAGDAGAVSGAATGWTNAKTSADAIAAGFETTLKRLTAGWGGPAGREYAVRMAAIGTYARTLAASYGDVSSGLTVMGQKLRWAQAEADKESPEKVDDHDKTVSNALTGAAIGSTTGIVGAVPGAIIGAFHGHEQDEKEKAQARQRTIELIEQVATVYAQTTHLQLPEPPQPPREMPVGVAERAGGTTSGPAPGNPSTVSGTHAAGVADGSKMGDVTPVNAGPSDLGTTDVAAATGDPNAPGTSLAGASSGNGATLAAAAAAVGVGGLLGGQLATTGPAGTALTAGMPGGMPLGSTAQGAPVRGGRGMPDGSVNAVRSGTGGTGAASARGRGLFPEGRPAPGRSGSTGSANLAGRQGAMASSARTGDDDAPEHDTWLTEDQLVWGDDTSAMPPVLGHTPATEPTEPTGEPTEPGADR